ncbi:MAG: tRNA (adenosine(37)-N6)-threonylcarbamoyltransferase complex dimerization subunit type 1 TsaB [Parvularculaceae bacterium]
MRVLAFDTAFDACSVAILESEKTLWSNTDIIGRGHAEVLPPMAARALEESNLKIADFDRIGVVTGPGAFAGIRVGVAFARGLALASGIEAHGVSSLRALHASAPQFEADAACVFDARRGQVYAALYAAGGTELIAPFVAAPDDAATRIRRAAYILGNGAVLVNEFLPNAKQANVTTIDPVAIARLVAGAPPSSLMPLPIYLRPPDAAPGKASPFAELLRP